MGCGGLKKQTTELCMAMDVMLWDVEGCVCVKRQNIRGIALTCSCGRQT